MYLGAGAPIATNYPATPIVPMSLMHPGQAYRDPSTMTFNPQAQSAMASQIAAQQPEQFTPDFYASQTIVTPHPQVVNILKTPSMMVPQMPTPYQEPETFPYMSAYRVMNAPPEYLPGDEIYMGDPMLSGILDDISANPIPWILGASVLWILLVR